MKLSLAALSGALFAGAIAALVLYGNWGIAGGVFALIWSDNLAKYLKEIK